MAKIPASWMPAAKMQRVIAHWTAGGHKANATDKKHYHIIVEADGTPVRGNKSIKANEAPTVSGQYAAHTLNSNSGSIGVSMACMAGAVESPFDAGKSPMTREQWDAMIGVIAELCARYGIPVTPQTVLSHAEVQGTLGITQRGKWDFTRLAFDPSVKGAKACGDKMRAEIIAVMTASEPPAAEPSTGLPTPPEMPMLAVGSFGAAVDDALAELRKHGFSPETDFGEAARQATEAFQAAKGLDTDGKIGGQTWAALRQVPGAVPPPVIPVEPGDSPLLDRAPTASDKGGHPGNPMAVMDYLIKSWGLTPTQASGPTGHAQVESYDDIRFDVVGDGGKSYGMWQWLGARWAALKKWPNYRTIRGQLEFAWDELTNGDEGAALKMLRAAATVDESAAAWMRFERPAGYSAKNHAGTYRKGSHWDRRLARAQARYDEYLARSAVAIRDALQPAPAPQPATTAAPPPAPDWTDFPELRPQPESPAPAPPPTTITPKPTTWRDIMRKLLWPIGIGLLILASALAPASAFTPALAAEVMVAPENSIVIPWGGWAQLFLSNLTEVALAAVAIIAGYAAKQVPLLLRPFIDNKRVETLIRNAVLSAIAKAKDAVAGKQLSVQVNSQIVRYALEYALAHAGPGLIQWMGGSLPMIVDKILAQMVQLGIIGQDFDLAAAAEAVRTAPRTQEKAREVGIQPFTLDQAVRMQ